MKKKLVLILSVCFIVACTVTAIAVFGNNKPSGNLDRNTEIYAVYEQYVVYAEENGETPLSYEEWLSSIKGEKGEPGKDGEDGKDGENGLSAYQIWLNAGNIGSEQDFLNWLKCENEKDFIVCEHNYGNFTEVLAPTCTSIGYKIRNCSICCNTEYEFIAEKGHDYEYLHIIFNSNEKSITLYYCKNCSTVKQVEHKHDYKTENVQATCIKQGYTAYNCKECDHSYNDNYLDATGVHTYENGVCTGCGCEMAIWDGSIANKFSSGNGSAENPYVISNGSQLAYLAKIINESNANDLYNKYYKLVNNIDLAGLEWDPIGCYYYTDSGAVSSTRAFRGVFDGNGFTVSNFKITTPKQTYNHYFGLFGYVYGGTVKNLGVENFVIDITLNQYAYLGGLIGSNTNGSIISNCYAAGSISVNEISSSTIRVIYAGGLIGYNSYDTTVRNCYAVCEVSAVSSACSAYAGGLVGYNDNNAKIINCYAGGNASAKTNSNLPQSYVGGLVGYNFESTLENNCYRYQGQILIGLQQSDLGAVFTLAQINSKTFYTETLGWSEEIWNFDKLDFENGKHPVLKEQ